ncbi:hypothetical protein G6048_06090 [Streptomyces sp. YC419]|uniref:DUF3592 domain-containing protein n=2 Tax=Streptomyces ureilyticus TaxID=1775131 RepID=A0ABX0DRH8_9ACTN|nr:hypothetical protein [Streptomyces ureilyticus]NGO41761.1 hypothetical protein [Streptomyces ureilyticus]
MDGSRRTKKTRLWRWRSNPLRRRDDVIDAWIVLAVGAVIAVGGTIVGLVTDNAAGEVFARQRAERHSVRAALLADIPRSVAGVGTTGDKVAARVRWTDRDGSVHTDKTLADTGLKAGSRIVVWTDSRGEITAKPPSPAKAAVEAGVLATGAALAFAGLAYGAGALARWRLDQRRIEQWGSEWDLVGPQWDHKTG